MWLSSKQRSETDALRCQLAALTVDTKLVRLWWSLNRKYSADQPRAPAGQSDGGQWVSEGGGTGPSTQGDGSDARRVVEGGVTANGSRVLSIRVRNAATGEWNEDHAVEAPDGTRFFFRTDGAVQSVYEGGTGALVSRSTWTDGGPVPDAVAQPAFLRTPLRGLPGLAPAVPSPVPSALQLYEFLASRNTAGRKAVIGFSAREYESGTPAADDGPRVT